MIRCVLAGCVAVMFAVTAVPEQGTAAEPFSLPTIERQVMVVSNTELDWRQARTDLFPNSKTEAITTMSQTTPKGSHGYRDVYFSLTGDAGKTWTVPEPIPSLRRARDKDGTERVASDLWPLKHPQSGTVLILGKLFVFENGTQENYLREEVAYAVYDPETKTVGPQRQLELPKADHEGYPFTAANAGCNQPLRLDNGEILLPIRYQKDRRKRLYTSIVARCRFDGTTLTYLEHGSEHSGTTGRGLYEPSVGEFGGQFFLAMRADDGAEVSRSDDGINFSKHQPLRFDDGDLLGSHNTQLHWLTVGGRLYLVYTRKGAMNDNAFRHRAPLFLGQFDPDRLCVIRETEQVLIPNDGGLYGNSGVCQISEHEAWVTCADDGGKRSRKANPSNEVILVRVLAP